MRQKASSILESVALKFAGVRRGSREKTLVIPILLAFGEITHFEGGGGDSLIKVGTDVRRLQNLGWKQFPQKT